MNKFLEEIQQQPEALASTLNYYCSGEGQFALERVVHLWQSGDFDRMIFTGMGSSYFISYAATCLLSDTGVRAFAINAGELLHYQLSSLDSKTLLVCISQSGESYEIVRILEKLPQGVTVVAICNEAESTLAKNANETLLSVAGREEMTSTKTFVSTYLVTYLLALALNNKFSAEAASDVNMVVDVVAGLLENKDQWLSEAVKLIAHTPFVQLVGRGPVFATTQQSALMVMEATCNPASALLGGEFRHGPMEMVRQGLRVVVFAPGGKTYPQSMSVTSDVLKNGGRVLFITDQRLPMESANLFQIVVPQVNEALFAIMAVIPMQLIVNQWAIEESIVPGNFTNGAKVTTIE